jgi:hypothetical protein
MGLKTATARLIRSGASSAAMLGRAAATARSKKDVLFRVSFAKFMDACSIE